MARSTFHYYEPDNIKEAISLLGHYEGKAKLIAGGTDFLVKMRDGEMAPEHVISLAKIPQLHAMSEKPDGGLTIGACTTIRTLEQFPLVKANFKPLADGVSKLGSIQIRNLATLGGNLCNASPAADCAPPLLTMGAVLSIVGPNGKREVKIEDFFTGPGLTTLEDNEILTDVHVSSQKGRWSGIYLRHSRRREVDLAIVGIAAVVIIDSLKGVCAEARIALGAVAPTPLRVTEAELMLVGEKPSQKLLEKVSQLVGTVSQPISDVRASAEYRQLLTQVYAKRALEYCFRETGLLH